MAEANPPARNPCVVQVLSPPSLTSYIDIVDRGTTPYQLEKPKCGALISFDFSCPSDSFYSQKQLVAKFNLKFTTQPQDGNFEYIEIQDAKVHYFKLNNNAAKRVEDLSESPSPFKTPPESFKNRTTVDIEMHQTGDYSNDGYVNVRIVVLLDTYPSNVNVSVSLSTTDTISRLSRTFTSADHYYTASLPSDERLQELLYWTAGFGHEHLFEAYLDQAPRGLVMEDAFGMTPFSWAALAGQATVIRLALAHAGCDRARKRTTWGPAPLEAAARSKDGRIFELFLKYLKHLKTSKDEASGSNEMPELDDRDIQQEINMAVRNEQTVTIQKLVEMLRDRQADMKTWLDNEMVKASEKGDFCHVQALKSCGAEVKRQDESKSPPLMSAINSNRTKIAEYLIIQGARDDGALRAAVEKKQHSTIRALLQAKPLEEGELKKELISCATKAKDSTTLMLLKLEEKGTGMLATSSDLRPEVDELFQATVVDFSLDQSPEFQELSVNTLMNMPETFFDLAHKTADGTGFKWFHLPANNMKWVEALINKIYQHDPSLAYKVLEPKRWVKRQHEGVRGSPHARFMMPACHDFSEAFKDKKGEKSRHDKEDKHVFLFMPYLHWDEEEAMKKRSTLVTESSLNVSTSKDKPEEKAPTVENALLSKDEPGKKVSTIEKEEMLLKKYLLEKNSGHTLHIRRTLDQFLYHNLKDTKVRDADQTVRRYQEELNKDKDIDKREPFRVIMVDQLWLWILLGPSGNAQAIITCFPSRDWSDVDIETGKSANSPQKMVLDPRRTTDVLQITKAYIQQRPNAVKTPYDLAGVIASRCSRALLDHSDDELNFAEVYENSISYIMNEEVLLFNTFNDLMQTRSEGTTKKDEPNKDTSYKALASDIRKEIQSLDKGGKIPKDPVDLCKKYRRRTLDTEIPDENEIKELGRKYDQEKRDHLIKLLEKFGRFYVLDITREIALLRQIKDIEDELEMMGKVFADQKEVLEAMDRIIRLMAQSKPDTDNGIQTEISGIKSNSRRVSNSSTIEGDYNERRPVYLKKSKSLERNDSYSTDYSSSTIIANEHPSANDSQVYLGKETQKGKDTIKQTQSIIWEFRHQKQNLPLRTVSRFSEQIKKMNGRAKSANKALNTLVDLKQKQNNMIDARTARIQAEQSRIQAEQSHLMTIESEKQSRTLMVFTIVTILFLPLSFIAAFFAIPTKEFGTGNLSLDFVSKIIFPVSAVTSILFIIIGFAASASDWKWLTDKIPSRFRGRKRNDHIV